MNRKEVTKSIAANVGHIGHGVSLLGAKAAEVVSTLKHINEQLRKEAGVSKRQLKKGLRRVNPVLSKAGPGRNESCWCGSGIKYKKCCINKKPWK